MPPLALTDSVPSVTSTNQPWPAPCGECCSIHSDGFWKFVGCCALLCSCLEHQRWCTSCLQMFPRCFAETYGVTTAGSRHWRGDGGLRPWCIQWQAWSFCGWRASPDIHPIFRGCFSATADCVVFSYGAAPDVAAVVFLFPPIERMGGIFIWFVICFMLKQWKCFEQFLILISTFANSGMISVHQTGCFSTSRRSSGSGLFWTAQVDRCTFVCSGPDPKLSRKQARCSDQWIWRDPSFFFL